MWIPQCRCQWCELWVISWCTRSWMQASKRLTRWSPLEKRCKRPPNMYLHPHHPGQVFFICRACSKWSPPAHTYRSSGHTDLIFPNQDLYVVQQQMYTYFEQSSLLLPRDKELQHTDICLPELHPHRNKSLYMIVPWWSRNWGVNFIMFPVPRGYCCFKSYAWALVSNRIIIMTVCWKTLVPYRTKALTLLWICSMQCQIGETKKCS